MTFSHFAKLSPIYCALIGAALGHGNLRAEELPNLPGIQAFSAIEVMQVSGSRSHLLSSQLVDNSMSSIEIIDSATVNPTIADWLINAPSISLNGQGGLFQSYSIRGFSRSRIRTEVDGIPIITDRRAGNSASFINSELLARIDIQQGPSATLYGSEAMGGVINLISAELGTKKLTASAQSDDQATNAALLWGSETWQTGFAYRHANQASAADNTPLDSDFEQRSALLKFSQSWQGLTVNGSSIVSQGNDIGKSSSQFPNERVVQYPTDEHWLSQLSLQKEQDWFVQLYQHYQNWDTDTLRVGNRRNLTQYQSHTLGALALASLDAVGGQGRLGFEWLARRGVKIAESEFSLGGQQNFAQPLVDGKQDSIALFSDWHWQWQNWQLDLGGRFDHINQTQFISKQSRDDQQFSASFRIGYQLNTQHMLSAEMATGFRFPTLSELYFAGETPRGITLGNPELAPEQSRGAQLNWQYQINSAWSIDVAGYYYGLDDYIERFTSQNDQGESFRSFRNLGRADIQGIEASVSWQGASGMSMQWLGHYQQGEDTQGDTLADLTPAKLSWHTQWQWRGIEFSNQLTWLKNQSEVGSGEVTRAHRFLWQASLSKSLTSKLTLHFYGKNLTDELAFASADEDASLLQGRTVGVKLDYQFD
ncbi:TonB-dependent receptor [Thalassotalea montiporae]